MSNETASQVVVEAINKAYPDRSAGRWCDVCNQSGAHHTDRHDEFEHIALTR